MFVCFLAVVKKELSQNVFDCLNYEIYSDVLCFPYRAIKVLETA